MFRRNFKFEISFLEDEKKQIFVNVVLKQNIFPFYWFPKQRLFS